MKPAYRHSIFVPCYNRGGVLDKTLQSVAQLDHDDFEVIVINDGSNDDTDTVVQRWLAATTFPIQYFSQSNQGKHAAHNKAVSMARGFFFITLDAGDLILRDALTLVDRHWNDIPEDRREHYAGISGLCLTESGEISGYQYPEDVIDSNYFEIFRIVPVGGEKREAIRTDILRAFPLPEYPGEKLVRPDLILRQISRRYRFRFINAPLEVNVREADGYTANIFRFRVTSPWSFYHYFREEITENYRYDNGSNLFYYYTRYVRYALHCGIGWARQWREAHNRLLWTAAIVPGLVGYLKDRMKKKRLGIPERDTKP